MKVKDILNLGDDVELVSLKSKSPSSSDPDKLKQMTAFLERYGIDTSELSPEKIQEKYDKIQNLASENMQVLSRGTTLDGIDRLLSYVPKGFRGEFFRDSKPDLDRARGMGWVPLKSEEANLDSPTGKSDGLVRLGDLVLFIIPEEEYVARQIAQERRLAESRARRKRALTNPSQGAGDGIDPMGGNLGAHPDHPIKPLSELRG
jgi:hypothetical protein